MNPFTTALVKAPSRSRFDFNHTNTVGLRIGVLTPTLTEFITPGDEVSMSVEQICRLAPMPVPTFTSLKVRHDFFFVPLRLMYGNDYLDTLFGSESHDRNRAYVRDLAQLYGIATTMDDNNGSIDWSYHNDDSCGLPVPGHILDYLGYPVFTDRNGALTSDCLSDIAHGMFDSAIDELNLGNTIVASQATPFVCIEKFLAYHYIWRDWYRFTGIQDNSIVEPFIENGFLSRWNETFASIAYPHSNNFIADYSLLTPYVRSGNLVMSFGDVFGKLRLAHLTKDMFLSARYGNKPTVLIPTGQNGTIPALREASAIQRFLDLISITGQRYFDKVKGLFGVDSEGPKDDRVQFLARYQQYIKVGEVLTTATTSEAQTGDYAGRGILIDGKYLFKRRFTEHGYLFCISSVIPDVAYNGLGRDITDVNVLDTPVPTLAQVGDQTIFNREVAFDFGVNPDGLNYNNLSFGDQFRYYAYKSHNNEVHGFFLMKTASPWSPLLPIENSVYDDANTTNVIGASRVYPFRWNQLFNDTSDEPIFGDRLFFNIDFYETITRALPKYINYHL